MSRKPDHPYLDRSKINDSGVCWHRLKIYPFLKLGLELPCLGIYHGDAFVSLESYRVRMSAVRDMRFYRLRNNLVSRARWAPCRHKWAQDVCA